MTMVEALGRVWRGEAQVARPVAWRGSLLGYVLSDSNGCPVWRLLPTSSWRALPPPLPELVWLEAEWETLTHVRHLAE